MKDLSMFSNDKFKPELNDIHKILDATIVGEYASRLSLFITLILAERYVCMRGSSRSGKTWCMENIQQFISDNSYTITQGSKKSGWYDAEQINKADYIFLTELNKVPEDIIEVLKSWGEGKTAVYKTTIQYADVGRKLETYKIDVKPFVFALADENKYEIPSELLYRLVVINTDGSEEQNRKVRDFQARLSKNPAHRYEVDTDLLNNLKMHIKTLPPFQKFEYINPAADILKNSIPTKFTDSRTTHPIMIDAISGIQRFYWKESVVGKIKGINKPVMFISPKSMWLNDVIFNPTLIKSCLKVNDIEKEIILILQRYGAKMDRKQVAKDLRKSKVNVTHSLISKYCNNLVDMGYLERFEITGMQVQYELSESFEDYRFDINWKEVIEESKKTMKEYYPDFEKEYEETYLKDLNTIHPFTGKKVSIDTFSTVKSVNSVFNPQQKEVEEVVEEIIETPIDFIRNNHPDINGFIDRFGDKELNNLKEQQKIMILNNKIHIAE